MSSFQVAHSFTKFQASAWLRTSSRSFTRVSAGTMPSIRMRRVPMSDIEFPSMAVESWVYSIAKCSAAFSRSKSERDERTFSAISFLQFRILAFTAALLLQGLESVRFIRGPGAEACDAESPFPESRRLKPGCTAAPGCPYFLALSLLKTSSCVRRRGVSSAILSASSRAASTGFVRRS